MSAVGIDNDLTTRKTSITMRTTDDELTSRVDKEGKVLVEERTLVLIETIVDNAWDEDVLDVLTNLGKHLLVVSIELVMLGRDDDGINAHRLIGLAIILDGHLTLGIRTEVWHRRWLFATDLVELDEQQVAKLEGQRHAVVGLVGGIAEHHTLIAGTLLLRIATLNATVDIDALCMESREDTAALAVKFVLGLGVADLADGLAHLVAKLHVGSGLDLACQYDLASGYEGLTSYLALWIPSEKVVKYCVADLVSDLVWVSLRHRFGSE